MPDHFTPRLPAVERTCETCGATFRATAAKLRIGAAKFCSRPCTSAARGNPPVRLTCANCAADFVVVAARLKRGIVQFCSTACRWETVRRLQVRHTCERCGISYAPNSIESKVGRGRRFCSRECYGKEQRQVGVPLVDRFWGHVNKTATCWLWAAGTSRGYGSFWAGGRISAHRFAWESTHGGIPDDLFVLHNCPGGDNPLCVRPDHLFLGTQADNMRDMVQKGRSPCARLTPEHVLEIRTWLIDGVGPTEIARAYGVTRTAITSIKKGRNWVQD